MTLFGYFAAVLMGLSLGLLGGGGSILTVPILIYFFRMEPLLATTASLAIVGSTALIGMFLNLRKGLVDLKTGAFFAVPSFAGVFLIRRILLPALPENWIWGDFTFSKGNLVLATFAILMILASRAMLSSSHQPEVSNREKSPRLKSVVGKGFVVGTVTGFVGAGGGFLIVPALVILLHLPMHLAVGTSLAIIAANSLFGFAISHNRAEIHWSLVGALIAISYVGIFIGSYLSAHVPATKLKRIFAAFILIVGTSILVEQFVHLRP